MCPVSFDLTSTCRQPQIRPPAPVIPAPGDTLTKWRIFTTSPQRITGQPAPSPTTVAGPSSSTSPPMRPHPSVRHKGYSPKTGPRRMWLPRQRLAPGPVPTDPSSAPAPTPSTSHSSQDHQPAPTHRSIRPSSPPSPGHRRLRPGFRQPPAPSSQQRSHHQP
jgi:hypothetical protein